jgi:thiol-disulfide isomerase/thioredoxin
MAATPSKPLDPGSFLPRFTLTDAVTRERVTSDSVLGHKGTLVMFVCNHCPYVVHIRPELVRAAHEALAQGFGVVAINANSLRTHPQDGPDNMRELAQQEGWRFPFLFDAHQDVARAFDAACTPDLYLFDPASKLAYHGQFDASRPHNGKPVTGEDLRRALAQVAAGETPPLAQTPSVGCNIKWD